MDYLLQADEHIHCRRTDEGPGFRLLAHPTQVSLLDSCVRKDITRTEICTCHFLTTARNVPDFLEHMSTLGSGAYTTAWTSGRLNALRFAFLYRQMASHQIFPSPVGELKTTTTIGSLAKTLRYHPAVVGGLGFLFDNHFTSPVMRLLADIYDIERFRKPGRENSISCLKNYFRVVTSKATHKQLQCAEDGTIAGNVAVAPRLALALDAWYTHPVIRLRSYGYIFQLYKNQIEHFMSCGRTLHEAQGDAAWRTTVKLLQFVFWTWVTPLHDSQTLDANRFFSDVPGAAEEFTDYIRHPDLDNLKLMFGPFNLP